MLFFAYKLVAFASVLKYRSHLSVSMLRIYNELYARVTVTDILSHGLRTPNEGINQRNLKFWTDVADKICFGRT